MSNERTRIGFRRVVLAVFGLTLLGGCKHADPPALQTFIADLLRNAAAALLL